MYMELLISNLKFSVVFSYFCQGSCRPLNSLKVLEFEMPFQGHLKLLENENFSLKIEN